MHYTNPHHTAFSTLTYLSGCCVVKGAVPRTLFMVTFILYDKNSYFPFLFIPQIHLIFIFWKPTITYILSTLSFPITLTIF